MHKDKILSFIILLIIFLFIPQFVFGQLILSKSQQKRSGRQQGNDLSMEERISLEEKGYPVPTAQALEKIVDPETYIVGPGDIFYINISVAEEVVIPSQVTPEGKLVIETIGTLFVDGKTLAEVQQDVRQAGMKKYKFKKVTANLVQLRTFRVHVVGEVENPGTFVALAVDRVSVLIDRASSITNWADQQNIEIRHTDGSVDSLDLFKFKKLAELEQNISVRNGDVIYVPAIQLSNKTVSLEGNVGKPGLHQIKEGERLTNFLLRLNAFKRTLDPQRIYIIRKDEQGEEKIINVNLLGKGNNLENSLPHDVALHDGDQVYVATLKYKIYVHGAVNLPGAYSYNAGFNARDYVGLAGGTVEMGNVNGIKVIHYRDNSIEKGPNATVERGDTIIVPRAFRKSLSEYLQIFTGLATLVFAFMAAQK